MLQVLWCSQPLRPAPQTRVGFQPGRPPRCSSHSTKHFRAPCLRIQPFRAPQPNQPPPQSFQATRPPSLPDQPPTNSPRRLMEEILAHYCHEKDAVRCAVQLAHQYLFGTRVMATHTAGTLDPVRMGHIKEILLAKFGGRRRSAVDCEAIWGKCKIAIGQKCKDEDEDSHSHSQASEGKHIREPSMSWRQLPISER